jgi:DNA uptake protein ComE-like DNA-binding protein
LDRYYETHREALDLWKTAGETAAPGAAEEALPTRAVPAAAPPREGALVSLNSASFEQLRELEMSVTQANGDRLPRRPRRFDSVDDLDEIPGFPRTFLAELKGKLTA